MRLVRRAYRAVTIGIVSAVALCTAMSLPSAANTRGGGYFVAAHSCVHDSVVVPLLRAEDLAFPNATRPIAEAPYELSLADRAAGLTLAVGPMRFAVRTPDLYDASKYCTTADGTTTNMQGGSIACSAEAILTDAKRDILLNQLLPEALRRLSAALSVTQVTGNLIVPRGACASFTIPSADSTSGVAGADFVLYVSAAPASSGTIAWAGYCSRDAAGRPVVGRTNISPRYIANDEYTIRVVMHELAHALGFSSALFLGSAQTTKDTIRGKTATFVTSSNVVAAYREFTGCATITGPEIEDEGGSGTVGSHWERRNLRDDLMCGIAGAGRLSKHTLAVFEDSGLYTVDYGAAETMAWGSDAGCPFLTEKCTSTAAGLGTYWCNTTNQGCTFDRKAIGMCDITSYTSNLPTAFQYFSDPTKGGSSGGLMDYCPTVVGYSNRQCDDATYSATSSDLIFGLTFAAEARCFDTSSFIKSGYSTSAYPRNTCLKVRCVDGARLEVAVHNTGWIACPTSGAAGTVTVSGYSGSIQCPEAATFCGDSSLLFNTSPLSAPVTGGVTAAVSAAQTTTTASTMSDGLTMTSQTAASAAPTTTVSGGTTINSDDRGTGAEITNNSTGENNTTVPTTSVDTTTIATTTVPAPTPVPATVTTKAPDSTESARYYVLVLRGRYLGVISALPSFAVSLVADLATAFATTSSSIRVGQQALSQSTAADEGSSLSAALVATDVATGGQGRVDEISSSLRLTVAFSVTPLAIAGVETTVEDLTFLGTSGASVSWLMQIRALHRAAALAAAAAASLTTTTSSTTTTWTTAAPTSTTTSTFPTTTSTGAALNTTATTNTPTNATALPAVPSPLTTTTGNNTTRETPAPSALGVDAHEGAAVVAGSDGAGDTGDNNNGAGILTVTATTSIPGDDLAVVSASLDPVRTGASPPVRSAACGGPRGVGAHASVGFVVALIGWLALS